MRGLIRARNKHEYASIGGKPRNYKREYKKFHSTKEAIAERSNRNKARRQMEKLGRVKKGDRKDVHHANRRPLDNRPGNLKVMSRSRNRAIK
jgi:hypothetical protein